MTMTNMGTDMKTTRDMKTSNSARALRWALALAAGCLLFAPLVAVHAADDRPTESAVSAHAKSFGVAVKRDAKAVGAACKEGAHRVAVASTAVGHEIATAAKRSAAGIRFAFRGEKTEAPRG